MYNGDNTDNNLLQLQACLFDSKGLFKHICEHRYYPFHRRLLIISNAKKKVAHSPGIIMGRLKAELSSYSEYKLPERLKWIYGPVEN